MDRLTDRLDMTLVVDWAIKPQYRQNEESEQTGRMLILFLAGRTNHLIDFVMSQPMLTSAD